MLLAGALLGNRRRVPAHAPSNKIRERRDGSGMGLDWVGCRSGSRRKPTQAAALTRAAPRPRGSMNSSFRLGLVLTLVATSSLTGCYLEVGTGGGGDETEETESEEGTEEEVETDVGCDIYACENFCNYGGSCGYEEGTEGQCVTDCLESCDDGFSDEVDAAVMDCVDAEIADPWCTAGVLDKCCTQIDGFSDLCF